MYGHDYHLRIYHYLFCMDLTQTAINLPTALSVWLWQPRRSVFTARYELNVCSLIKVNIAVTDVRS